MSRPHALFIALSLLGAVLVLCTWRMVYLLTPEHRRKRSLRWLLFWWLKGCALPLALWEFVNLGLTWSLPPFMPDVQFAQNSGVGWGAEYLRFTGFGMFIVSSFWMAVTLAWVLTEAGRHLEGETRSDFFGLCTTCALGLSLPAIGLVALGGWPILGLAFSLIVGPIAWYAPGILNTRKMPPMYARAIARMKFGKYNEAEWEIIRELEKCEDDFQGWMMLAELYASHFKDLKEAEQTVLDICDQPKTTPSQLSVALHRLSEWYLNLGDDPEAARRALLMIIARLPGTHLAHMAQLRINQLPETLEELYEQRSHKPIPLVSPGAEAAATLAAALPADREQAIGLANSCVERLTQDPNDASEREKLALLLAERLGKADQGIEQLVLLLNMPDQPDAKRAEWLSLSASWHLKYQQDSETARKFLERLIREFPRSTQAAAARRQLQRLA